MTASSDLLDTVNIFEPINFHKNVRTVVSGEARRRDQHPDKLASQLHRIYSPRRRLATPWRGSPALFDYSLSRVSVHIVIPDGGLRRGDTSAMVMERKRDARTFFTPGRIRSVRGSKRSIDRSTGYTPGYTDKFERAIVHAPIVDRR